MDLFINLYHLFHKAMNFWLMKTWMPGFFQLAQKKQFSGSPFWRYFVYLLLPGGLGILKTLFRFAWPNWMRDLAPISPRCTFPCPSCRWRDMSWPVVLVNFWRLPRRLLSPRGKRVAVHYGATQLPGEYRAVNADHTMWFQVCDDADSSTLQLVGGAHCVLGG